MAVFNVIYWNSVQFFVLYGILLCYSEMNTGAFFVSDGHAYAIYLITWLFMFVAKYYYL